MGYVESYIDLPESHHVGGFVTITEDLINPEELSESNLLETTRKISKLLRFYRMKSMVQTESSQRGVMECNVV